MKFDTSHKVKHQNKFIGYADIVILIYNFFRIMKLNSNVKIVGRNVVLVPYKEHHVPKYHEWMQSEELRHLTASLPLTLEQEYAMQKSWYEDEDKCTFIILDKSVYDKENNEVDAMIGDTNIFILDRDRFVGEIEIMIAEESNRGKKLGWEAVNLMLIYGMQHLNIKIYEAKIVETNEISISLFVRLTFEEKGRSEVFQEIVYEKVVDDEWAEWLNQNCLFDLQML